MIARLRFPTQRGFSLIELLVAFSILAMSLGLIYRSMGSSARNAGELAGYQHASMLVQALLNARESVGRDGWNESGESGALRWKVTSQLIQSPSGSPQELSLYEAHIVVTWLDQTRPATLEVKTLLPLRKSWPGEVSR